jgi:hypothetical protein
MRALASLWFVLGTGCSATVLYEPKLQISPYLAVYQLRGDAAVQTRSGGGVANNSPQSMRTFGQDRFREDFGIRADLGDGFGGARLDYYRLDMDTTKSGELTADWGNLQAGDAVRMRATMDEFRLGYVEPLWTGKFLLRERPLEVRLGAGGHLARRDLTLRGRSVDGSRAQNLHLDGDLIYAAARARVSWQRVQFDIDYGVSPDLALRGDFGRLQQDLELRIGYTVPLREITVFAGYRFCDLDASGREGAVGYRADLQLEGFQFGVAMTF